MMTLGYDGVGRISARLWRGYVLDQRICEPVDVVKLESVSRR